MDYDQVYQLITKCQEKYNNGSVSEESTSVPEYPEYTDAEFDALVDFYEQGTGKKVNLIGSRPSERVVELPYVMPSLDKIKGKNVEKDLNKFLERYPAPVLIQDKLDGISILAVYENNNLKIYNRGDGQYGQDISYISDYINFPRISHTMVVRGELIMHKSDFENLQETLTNTTNKMKKARTLVNGAITKKDASSSLLKYCRFYAFEIVYNTVISSTPEYNIHQLREYGFDVPFSEVITTPTVNSLTDILTTRREEAPYEIDGIVLISNIPMIYSSENENPKHKIAFKIDTLVISKVLNIEWGLTSRYGYLTPIIHIEPVDILGSEVCKASGHNAKYIMSKQLGIGALVEVTLSGDIIPQVANVLISSPNIPAPSIPYHWNESGVEILVNDLNIYPEIRIQSIASFLTHLSIKCCGVATITKIFYGANIQTIDGFLVMKEVQISHIAGLGDKSASNICAEIQKGIKNATYPKLMVGTGIFGEGIGEQRFSDFIEAYPSWKYSDVTVEEVERIPGFGPIISQKIATFLPDFKEWFWNRITLFGHLEGQKNKIEGPMDLKGQIIVFSGFRDDTLKTQLENRGAKVPTSLTKSATMLIVKSLTEPSTKMTEAQTRGIPIVEKNHFR